jgi:hypothetical protein
MSALPRMMKLSLGASFSTSVLTRLMPACALTRRLKGEVPVAYGGVDLGALEEDLEELSDPGQLDETLMRVCQWNVWVSYTARWQVTNGSGAFCSSNARSNQRWAEASFEVSWIHPSSDAATRFGGD